MNLELAAVALKVGHRVSGAVHVPVDVFESNEFFEPNRTDAEYSEPAGPVNVKVQAPVNEYSEPEDKSEGSLGILSTTESKSRSSSVSND